MFMLLALFAVGFERIIFLYKTNIPDISPADEAISTDTAATGGSESSFAARLRVCRSVIVRGSVGSVFRLLKMKTPTSSKSLSGKIILQK